MPSPIIELVCRALDGSRLKDCPDEALVRRFVGERDGAAFEAILRRHGPMVLDVCRGLLPNDSDTEDAFQATFLILAQKAASIHKTRSLASWLHGVAYRVARRAQTAFARRQKHEQKHEPRVAENSTPQTTDDLTWAEIRKVLHEELNSLPNRLRGPLILCYLEGMSQDQAAAELGLPKGTLKGRLEHGRESLRSRLVRRGLGPAAVLLASAWPVAPVSAALVASTVATATSVAAGQAVTGLVSTKVGGLAGEVLKTMSLTKFRTALLAVAVLCAGITAVALHASADSPKVEKRDATEPAEQPVARPGAPQPKLVWQEGPATIPAQAGPVHALAFDPNGKMLAVASTSILLKGEVRGEIKVYDLTNGKELTILSGFAPVAFSPDGKMLAAREGDNTVRVWEVGTWMPKIAMKGLSDTVLSLAFRPDRTALVAGSGDPSRQTNPGMVRLWDLENGQERATHTHPGAVYAVAFAADGKTFLSASSGLETVIKSWDGRSGQEPVETKGSGRRFMALAFSPDGKKIATGIDPVGNTSEMDVTLWDRATGKELLKLRRHPEYVQAMAFTPDGKTLVTGSSALAGETARIGVARLWDVETGKELADLRGHKGEIRCLAFGPQGRTLVTGSWDGTVKLWVLAAPEDENDELWVKSADGVLALRVSAFVKTAKPGDPIELVARLQNLSDKPVNVLRPFGDSPFARAVGVEIRDPRGKLGYKGDPEDYSLGANAFVRLGPGESIRDSLKLTARDYADFDKPGRYTITFTYSYKGNWDKVAEQAGLKPIWQGTVVGKSIPIEIRDAEEGTWVKSADGVLALRLAPAVNEVKPGDPIEVNASLKNLTDKPVNILQPFGDFYLARSAGIDLQGPRSAIRYSGPELEYTLGDTAFVTLGPGEVVSDRLSMSVDEREGSDRAGEYRVTFTYHAGDGHRATAKGFKLADLWNGQIKSGTVVVKKVDPKLADDKSPKPKGAPEPVKAVFDPEDERVKGFVADLERSGIKLAPEKENKFGRWRVVEPKIAGGTVFVGICSFTGPASEKQMREALSDFSWGWQYTNTHSRLSMSLGTILTEGFEKPNPNGGFVKEMPDEVSDLYEKLRVRFFWYKREKRPAEPLTNERLNADVRIKDERVQAFVDYLGRNGIKLTATGTPGEWQIVEPEHKDGTPIVRIRGLPVAATEEQMRWALSQSALPFQLNADAHLAVSHIGLRGPSEKGLGPEVKALERKLMRLLHDYHPASFAAQIRAGELPDEGVKEAHALWKFLDNRGFDLRYIENSTNYIQYLFAVGPDHDKRLCIGFGYIPPAKADKLKERYRDYSIPHVIRGNLVLFKVGAANGNDTKEFVPVWEKVEAAFKEFPGPAKVPNK